MSRTFADDPAGFFDYSLEVAHKTPQRELEALQLETLQSRFARLVELLPPLQSLAAQRDISKINALDDAPALFFHHSVYKSYPEGALENGDFGELTAWLSHFTTHDLSPVLKRDFDTIDAWMDALDQLTNLRIQHSSGTTGRLSLHPRGKSERGAFKSSAQMWMESMAAPGQFDRASPDLAMIWPAYAGGRSNGMSAGEVFAEAFCQSADDFHPLMPNRLSADYQHYLMQVKNAEESGQERMAAPSEYVMGLLNEAEQLRRTYPERIEAMLDLIESGLGGKRTFIAGGPMILYQIAMAGAARGMENAFVSGSVIASFGGFKGLSPAGDEEAVVRGFTGIAKYWQFYGMTELTSGMFMCEHGRYHVPPWIVPYVIDPETGDAQPREGSQRGLAAFMDLAAQSYWGGVISADMVEMSWEPCSCGRTTPHIGEGIERIEGWDLATDQGT